MDFVTRQLVVASTLAGLHFDRMINRVSARQRDDRGQASTEYAGILFVIVAIIAALVALSWTDVGNAIKGKIVEAIGKLQ